MTENAGGLGKAPSITAHHGRRAVVTGVALVVALLGAALPAAATLRQTADSTWMTNGRVLDVLRVGNRVYLAGEFTEVRPSIGATGTPRRYLAAFDATTGDYVPSWAPNVDAYVEALAVSPDGTRIFAAGPFKTVNGSSRKGLVALDPATGAVQAGFSASITGGRIRAVALSGSRLYLGGTFGAVNGVARARLAAVSASTGALDTTWTPVSDGMVRAVAVPPDASRVYVGGEFNAVNGRVGSAKLTAVDPVTGADVVAFTPNPGRMTWSIAATNDRVYAGLAGGGGRGYVYRALDGVRLASLAADGDVQAVEIVGGKVYFGGHFYLNFGGVARSGAAAIYASTNQVVPDFAPQVDLNGLGVWSILGDGSRLHLGGQFLRVGAPGTGRQEGYARLSDDGTGPGDTTAPTAPQLLVSTGQTGSTVSLQWERSTDNVGVVGHRIFRDGIEAGQVTGTTFTDTGLSGGRSYTYTVAAVDLEGNVSAPSNAVTTGTPSQLVAARSVWRYLDNGSNQGTAWRASAFDDTTWRSGHAQLGYGDGDEATVVGFGPDPNARYITTYFRQSFTVADPAAVPGLRLGLLRDDGAVVYLNGTEVARSNMPAGTISAATPASTTVGGTDESRYYPFTVDPRLLVSGRNTLAVEVHQVNASSSDLSFDLQLDVLAGQPDTTAPSAPADVTVTGTTPTSVDLAWNASTDNVGVVGYRVFRNGTQVGAVASPGFTDAGLASTTSYTYTVRAFDGAGNVSASSAPVTATTASDTSPPTTPGDLTVSAVTNNSASLAWTASTDDVGVTGYRVRRDGTVVATVTATSFTDTGLAEGTTYRYTVEASDGPNTSALAGPVRATTTLLLTTTGSVWRYLDDGSDQGTAWRAPAFDDGAWRSGPSQLGYGDGDEATVVGYGPDPTSRYVTTYFRRTVTVADPAAVTGLTLELLRDDGAVVYLNGVEVVRDNMRTGDILSRHVASAAVNGTDESTFFPFAVDPSLLVSGTNSLAVEIHQNTRSSNDISFDLRLTAAVADAQA